MKIKDQAQTIKYLTNEIKELLESKYFDAISNYRLLKHEKTQIEEKYKNKTTYEEKLKQALAESIKLINEDQFKAPEIKQDLVAQEKNKCDELFLNYTQQIEKLPQLEKRLKSAFMMIDVLHRLKITGMIKECDINLLKDPLNDKFFDELIQQLSDFPSNYKADTFYYSDIDDDKIEQLFNEEATQKVKECKSKKELRNIISKIGLFSQSGQPKAYTSKEIMQTVIASIDDSKKTQFVTRIYGLRQKIVDLQVKRQNELNKSLQRESFRQSYLS